MISTQAHAFELGRLHIGLGSIVEATLTGTCYIGEATLASATLPRPQHRDVANGKVTNSWIDLTVLAKESLDEAKTAWADALQTTN